MTNSYRSRQWRRRRRGLKSFLRKSAFYLVLLGAAAVVADAVAPAIQEMLETARIEMPPGTPSYSR